MEKNRVLFPSLLILCSWPSWREAPIYSLLSSNSIVHWQKRTAATITKYFIIDVYFTAEKYNISCCASFQHKSVDNYLFLVFWLCARYRCHTTFTLCSVFHLLKTLKNHFHCNELIRKNCTKRRHKKVKPNTVPCLDMPVMSLFLCLSVCICACVCVQERLFVLAYVYVFIDVILFSD